MEAQWRIQGAGLPQTLVNSLHILTAKQHAGSRLVRVCAVALEGTLTLVVQNYRSA